MQKEPHLRFNEEGNHVKNKNAYYANLHAAERWELLVYLNENMASTYLVNFALPLPNITREQTIIKGNEIVVDRENLTLTLE